MSINKLKVHKLYINGYTSEQIAKILIVKSATVRKCISRNFKHLKDQHEKSKIEKRDIEKILTKENNLLISSRNMVRINSTAYTTNSKGDLVRKNSIDLIYTNDMPKEFKNVDAMEYSKSYYGNR